MTNPLLEKFYELHPEKKEEPIVEKKTDLLTGELKESVNTLSSALNQMNIQAGSDQWKDWLDAYRNCTVSVDNGNSVAISRNDSLINSTNSASYQIKDTFQNYKMNYQFIEMAEKIKLQKGTVTNIVIDTDHYSNQTKYIFEVVQNGRSYSF